MNPIDALERAWTAGLPVVNKVGVDQLSAPTTCSDWDVRALLNHTLGECRMMARVNAGEPASNEQKDLVGEGTDLAETWARIAEESVESWRASGLDGDRTYFYGTYPAAASAVINLSEVLVHTWDLAEATGQEVVLDDDLARPVLDLYAAVPMDGLRAAGVFGAEVPVPAGAPATERMLGLLGRRP